MRSRSAGPGEREETLQKREGVGGGGGRRGSAGDSALAESWKEEVWLILIIQV